MQNLLRTLLFLLVTGASISAAGQPAIKKPSNRILVVSGGGARGAWGVGVAEALFETQGAYRAVFGTSTGSLMAPMILLQQFDSLKSYYTNVTQKSIFNKNPFKVKTVNGTVTTELKSFNAIWKLILGKPTLGESENLKVLIKRCFTEADFKKLKSSADSLTLSVAVTNMTTGNVEIKSTADTKANYTYEEMINWIWASSNQPIFMSYVTVNGNAYVDGGLREIVPLRAAVEFAIKHGIDTVDVIVNDAWEPQDKHWYVTKNKGYFKGGLMRVLEVYNANTLFYDLRGGALESELFDAILGNHPQAGQKELTVIIYSMPPARAARYRDDLGFDRIQMSNLVTEGNEFITVPNYLNDSTRHVYSPKRKP